MTGRASFRGQPLLVLGALLVGWTGLRVLTWQPPFELAGQVERLVAAVTVAREETLSPQTGAKSPGEAASARSSVRRGEAPDLFQPQPTLASPWLDGVAVDEPVTGAMPVQTLPGFAAPATPPATPPAPPFDSPRVAIGNNLLLLAGLSQMQIPAVLLAYLPGAGVPAAAAMPVPPVSQPRLAAMSRWSADSWLLLRRDTTTPILSGRPSYGRSQAGAVVRYRLAPGSGLQPQAHLRASRALAGPREQELAAGLSLRPLAGVPVRIVAEGRVTDTARGTRVSPAAYAVSEFPPLKLPLGTHAEAYVQAGYVGGRYATAFVDGQARVERPLARSGETDLSAGAGAWGGAQKGASRLDVGPTATVNFRLGQARGRVAADYRFRVAGEAEPSSGPALTVSAGF
ncbi:MAG: hypothetical protein ABIT16_10100 [Croceibacterium sp.]